MLKNPKMTRMIMQSSWMISFSLEKSAPLKVSSFPNLFVLIDWLPPDSSRRSSCARSPKSRSNIYDKLSRMCRTSSLTCAIWARALPSIAFRRTQSKFQRLVLFLMQGCRHTNMLGIYSYILPKIFYDYDFVLHLHYEVTDTKFHSKRY